MRRVGATTLEKAKINIATQETFEKLDGHSTASRPDISIRLEANGKTELIFVESKLPSTQGVDQLQRYADHLAIEQKKKSLAKASLVFITLNYEAAAALVVVNSQFQPAFYSTRWFQFYQHLKAHVNGDGLARELKLFMEENRMSLGNQFRSTDLVAMENFLSAKALMDETLNGEVSDSAWEILSNVSTLKKAPNQLRDHHRYVIYAGFGRWDFECLIGYWFPSQNPDEPVWVGITLGSNPNSEIGKTAIEAFRGWVKKSGNSWSTEQIDDSGWSEIHKCKPIQTFMVGADHVRAIKDHLLSSLEEVREFKAAFPNLAWGESSGESVTENG